MRDHRRRTPPRKTARKSVGVRELKIHAAGIVRQVRDSRVSYVVTHRGQAVGVILPIDDQDRSSEASETVDAAAAWDMFMRAGRKLEGRFTPEASGVRILSSMRR
jgi:prevent-host-death family protein